MPTKKRYEVLSEDLVVLDLFIEYVYSKKYLRNILKKNDKFTPYYGIMIMSIDEKDLKKIIKNKFKNKIIIR